MATGAPTRRLDSLQALRALAAFGVVFFHAIVVSETYSGIPMPSLHVIHVMGAAGVHLFFMISGFVMIYTTRHLPCSWGSVRYFLLRRITRIVPIYWLITTLVAVLLYVKPGVFNRLTFDWWHVVTSYLFIPSRNNLGEAYPVWGLGWTLNYEMFFYAVMGLLLFTTRRFTWLCLGFVTLVAWGRLVPSASLYGGFYTSPLLLLFVMGAAIAVWVDKAPPRWAGWREVALGAACFVVNSAFLQSWPGLWVVVLNGLGFGAIMVGVLSLEAQGKLKIPPLVVALGDSSYSLYLSHMLFYSFAAKLIRLAGFSGYMIYLVPLLVMCAMVTAHFLYLLLEKPMTLSLNAVLGLRHRKVSLAEQS